MIRHTLALLLLCCCSIAPALAQPQVPDDLQSFGQICFCNSRVATPQYPIGLDNNGRLLFAARKGVTREQLNAAGITYNESQIRMLKDWGLVRERNKVLTTAFPVLEPAVMAKLRARLRPVADRLMPALDPLAAAIQREMHRRGQAEATYAILFSYVLDGLVWEELDGSGKLPDQSITAERPFWAGTFWAVYPKQDEMPGTNGRSSGRAELRMLWTPKVVDQINSFYGSREAGEWIDALDKGSVLPALYPDAKAQTVLVREEANDAISSNGSNMAKLIAGAMAESDLSAELPQADESQRLLIGTHELVWMLLDRLVEKHRIPMPSVLTSGARSSSDLAPLVVGVLNRDRP